MELKDIEVLRMKTMVIDKSGRWYIVSESLTLTEVAVFKQNGFIKNAITTLQELDNHMNEKLK